MQEKIIQKTIKEKNIFDKINEKLSVNFE